MSEKKPPREATIFRVVKDKSNPFVMIDRRPIENKNLSFKAKGILAYLLSRPDGWEVNVPDLVNHSSDGPAAVRTGLKELREAGHIHYNTQREGGYIKKWVVEVYELPKPPEIGLEGDEVLDSDFRNVGTSPNSDFLLVENQQVENRREVIMNLSKNELKREGNTPALDFSKMTVKEAYSVKTLQVYRDATGNFPGAPVWEFVHKTISENALTVERIRPVYQEWVARGFRSENIKGILDVVLNGWKDGGVQREGAKPAVSAEAVEETKKMLAEKEAKTVHAVPMPEHLRRTFKSLVSQMEV